MLLLPPRPAGAGRRGQVTSAQPRGYGSRTAHGQGRLSSSGFPATPQPQVPGAVPPFRRADPPNPAPRRGGASSCRACLSQVVPDSRDQIAQAWTPHPVPASALPRPLLDGTQQRDHLLRAASGLNTCSSHSVNRDSGVLSSHPCWPLGFNFS